MINLRSTDADGLYPQQREAINKMMAWYKSPSKEFTLQGYAGTGKTFVMATFLRTIGAKINYCVTAPTHKALDVIEAQLGVKGKTLHALHGLRLNVDLATFDIENPQFDPRGTPHIQNYSLIVIDEASMIPSALFEYNRLASEKYKVKIIYLGDPLQLPPVNEAVGRVFTDVPDTYSLTEIVRQGKDHDLLELFIMLRDDIIGGTSNCINYLARSRDTIISKDFKVVSREKYGEELVNMFTSNEFIKSIDYIRQASYSKNSTARWNNFIRQHVVTSEEALCIDDLLTSYTTQLDSFYNPVIANSKDYVLDDIDRYVDGTGVSTFAVNLKGVSDKRISPKLLIADSRNPESMAKILEALNALHYRAVTKRGSFRDYYNFKNRILLMNELQLNEQNRFKRVAKDVDYGYALTIHKLQGSTLQNIAVDLKDIVYPSANSNYVTDVDLRNRLLYVGLSRATDKAIIHW